MNNLVALYSIIECKSDALNRRSPNIGQKEVSVIHVVTMDIYSVYYLYSLINYANE